MELGLLTNFIDISILNLLNNSINSSIYADLTILNLYDYTLPNNPINLPITPLDLGENRSHFRRRKAESSRVLRYSRCYRCAYKPVFGRQRKVPQEVERGGKRD